MISVLTYGSENMDGKGKYYIIVRNAVLPKNVENTSDEEDDEK